MTKTQLLTKLGEVKLTDDLRENVETYLNEFPEELSSEDIKTIDEYLASLQLVELKYAQTNNEMADVLEDLEDSFLNNDLATVNDSIKAAATELRNANDLLDVIDPPAAE